MTVINVINGKTIANRLKKAVNVGLIAAFAYSATLSVPRGINQWNYDNESKGISSFTAKAGRIATLSEGKAVIAKIAELEGKKYFVTPDFEAIKKIVYPKVSSIAEGEVLNAVKALDYVSAKSHLETYSREVFTDKSRVSELEKAVASCNPTNIEKKGDEDKLAENRLKYYNSAAFALNAMKQNVPISLDQKIVNASVDVLVDNLSRTTRDGVDSSLISVRNYLSSKKGTKVSGEVVANILAKDIEYVTKTLMPWDNSSSELDKHLSLVGELLGTAKVNVREQMSPIVNSVVDNVRNKTILLQKVGEGELNYIDLAAKLNDGYSLGRAKEVVSSYLVFAKRTDSPNRELVRRALSSAISLVESSNYSGKEDDRAAIADCFVDGTKGMSAEGRLVYNEIARQLYSRAGPKYSQRLGESERNIQEAVREIWKGTNSVLKINHPLASPDMKQSPNKNYPQFEEVHSGGKAK